MVEQPLADARLAGKVAAPGGSQAVPGEDLATRREDRLAAGIPDLLNGEPGSG
jgi:hypothetical protein